MRLDVIVINWNGHQDTIECVDSILGADHPLEVRVVVVENGSTDDSVEQILSWTAKADFTTHVCDAARDEQDSQHASNANLTVLMSNENRGFCEGNNLGAAYAFGQGADFVLVLNNDTVVPSDFFIKLLPLLESDDGKTIYSPHISYYPDTDTTWYNGGRFSRTLNPAYTDNGLALAARPGTTATDWVSGCATVVSRPAYDDLGLYDPIFFIWCEEWDFSLRARANGYKLLVANNAVLGHKVGKSLGIVSPLTFFYAMRNMLILRRRHLPGVTATAHSVVYLPFKALQALKFTFTKRDSAYLLAWIDAIRTRGEGGMWRYQKEAG